METQQTEETKKCPECKEDIKIDATLCRYCGTTIVSSEKNNMSKGCYGCLILIAMIVIIVFILNSGGSDTKSSKEIGNKNDAWVCAQMKIEDMLLSPKSADFEFGGATNSTKAIGNEKYEIKSYVDSENAFSAKIRKNFECTVKIKTEDNSCETYCKFI
jgi:hypothetical protein